MVRPASSRCRSGRSGKPWSAPSGPARSNRCGPPSPPGPRGRQTGIRGPAPWPERSAGGNVDQVVAQPALGVGMVGYAFMGAAHSQAWRTAARAFDLPLTPRMAALCGRDAAAVRAAADRYGWMTAETDWHALISRDDVQLVVVCTPADLHARIAIASLHPVRHLPCPQPPP